MATSQDYNASIEKNLASAEKSLMRIQKRMQPDEDRAKAELQNELPIWAATVDWLLAHGQVELDEVELLYDETESFLIRRGALHDMIEVWENLPDALRPAGQATAAPELPPAPPAELTIDQIWPELTERQREIAECLANGLNDTEIATKLAIERCSSIGHRQNIAHRWGITQHIKLMQMEAKKRRLERVDQSKKDTL